MALQSKRAEAEKLNEQLASIYTEIVLRDDAAAGLLVKTAALTELFPHLAHMQDTLKAYDHDSANKLLLRGNDKALSQLANIQQPLIVYAANYEACSYAALVAKESGYKPKSAEFKQIAEQALKDFAADPPLELDRFLKYPQPVLQKFAEQAAAIAPRYVSDLLNKNTALPEGIEAPTAYAEEPLPERRNFSQLASSKPPETGIIPALKKANQHTNPLAQAASLIRQAVKELMR